MANKDKKAERIPLNGVRQVLQVEDMDPTFHYCWVGDYPIRGISQVELFKQAGYEFVVRTRDHSVNVGDPKLDRPSQIGEKVSMPLGNQVMGYLMRVPNEIWQEEMQLLAKMADDQERSIYPDLDKDGTLYGSIKIQRK